MPDNIDVKDGNGTIVPLATDLIGGVHYSRHKSTWGEDGETVDTSSINPFPTAVKSQIGATNLATGQVSIDTTSGGVEIVASRATRRSITIVNHGTTDVFLGTGTVASNDGILLPGIKGAAITMNVIESINGIVSSGSQTISYVEEYE